MATGVYAAGPGSDTFTDTVSDSPKTTTPAGKFAAEQGTSDSTVKAATAASPNGGASTTNTAALGCKVGTMKGDRDNCRHCQNLACVAACTPCTPEKCYNRDTKECTEPDTACPATCSGSGLKQDTFTCDHHVQARSTFYGGKTATLETLEGQWQCDCRGCTADGTLGGDRPARLEGRGGGRAVVIHHLEPRPRDDGTAGAVGRHEDALLSLAWEIAAMIR